MINEKAMYGALIKRQKKTSGKDDFPLDGRYGKKTPKPFLEILARYYWFENDKIKMVRDEVAVVEPRDKATGAGLRDEVAIEGLRTARDAVIEKLARFYEDVFIGDILADENPKTLIKKNEKMEKLEKQLEQYTKLKLENRKNAFTFYSVLADAVNTGPLLDRGDPPIVLSEFLIKTVMESVEESAKEKAIAVGLKWKKGHDENEKKELLKECTISCTALPLAMLCYYKAFKDTRTLDNGSLSFTKGAFSAWLKKLPREITFSDVFSQEEGVTNGIDNLITAETSNQFSKFIVKKKLNDMIENPTGPDKSPNELKNFEDTCAKCKGKKSFKFDKNIYFNFRDKNCNLADELKNAVEIVYNQYKRDDSFEIPAPSETLQ
jgi:hypothetical protein